jgi:predicted HD superfamily hydrolase involved in NAD metabolism
MEFLSYEDIAEKVSDLLPEGRFSHSERVADVVEVLAEHWGLDKDLARLAGILHDSAKAENPASFKEKGIEAPSELLEMYEDFPRIWHAFAGPDFIEQFFDIDNVELHDAVKWHSTGCAEMTQFDQVLYIGDYIEPGRGLGDSEYIAELAKESLDEATFAVSTASCRYLMKDACRIHDASIACRNYYLGRLSSERAAEITGSVWAMHS